MRECGNVDMLKKRKKDYIYTFGKEASSSSDEDALIFEERDNATTRGLLLLVA